MFERLVKYYKEYSLNQLSLSVPEYVTTIEEALALEEDQAAFYYNRSKSEAIRLIEDEVITAHIETLIKVRYSHYDQYLRMKVQDLTPC